MDPEVPVRDDATELPTFRRGERVIDLLKDAGIGFEGRNVVDLGAGFGSLSIAAARAGANVVAVDVHTRRLGEIAARADAQGAPVRVIRANLLEGVPGVRDADIALLIGVVEYAGLWDNQASVAALQRRVFKTAHDCLRPGGQLVFASKNRLWPRFIVKDVHTGQAFVNALPRRVANHVSLRLDGVPYRHHIHSPRAWGRAMHEVGFDSVDCFFPFLSYQLPLRLARRPTLEDMRLARACVETKEELANAWGTIGSLRAALMVACASLRLPISHSVVAVATKQVAP